jgi:hypothetical protein
VLAVTTDGFWYGSKSDKKENGTMSYTRTMLLALATVCAVCGYGLCAVSQPLEFSVVPNKTTYVYEEPMAFRIVLKNVSDETVAVGSDLEPGGRWVAFMFLDLDGGGQFLGSDGWADYGAEPVDTIRLAPGESCEYRHEVYRPSRFDVGRYSAKVTYTVSPELIGETERWVGTLDAEPVVITVEQPVGEDMKALELLGDVGKHELWGGRWLDAVFGTSEEYAEYAKKLEQLVETYPNCTYAPYAHWMLGALYGRNAHMFPGPAFEDNTIHDFDKALEHIRISADRPLGEPWAFKTKRGIAGLLCKRNGPGDREEAESILRELNDWHPPGWQHKLFLKRCERMGFVFDDE